METPVGRLVVEIKELAANVQDRKFAEELSKFRHAEAEVTPGERLREAIKDATDQLRSYKATVLPELILVYDNVKIGGNWVYPNALQFSSMDFSGAMFGVLVSKSRRITKDGRSSGAIETHGGGRQMTDKVGRHVSAVGHLIDEKQSKPPRIDFYHNPFAEKQLSPCHFTHAEDRHFSMHKHPDLTGWHWSRFVGDSGKT